MIAEHAEAILPLLEATPIPVIDGEVPNGADPAYMAPHFTTDGMSPSRVGALDGKFLLRITVHCGGATAAAARGVASTAIAALVGKKPPVAGRTVHSIRLDTSPQPMADEVTGRHRTDQTVAFTWATDPA